MLGGFGFQQKPLDIVEKYCPKTGEWSQLPVSIIFLLYLLKKIYQILFLFFYFKSLSQKKEDTPHLLQ